MFVTGTGDKMAWPTPAASKGLETHVGVHDPADVSCKQPGVLCCAHCSAVTHGVVWCHHQGWVDGLGKG